MDKPSLHLIVEKGPKKGETLDRNPGSLIRIGRVVRGNTFSIKDPAISQKHLVIEFVDRISRWAATDLDTSNGTFINDDRIPSNIPLPLSDGDTIKIGESTSITVKIPVSDENEKKAEGELRRGRTRAARARFESSALVTEVENCEGEKRNGGRGRGRPKNLKKDEILVTEGDKDLDQVSKADGIMESAVDDSVDVPKKPGRGRGRGRKAPARFRASPVRVSKEEELREVPEVIEVEECNVETNVGGNEGKLAAGGEEELQIEDDMEKMTLGEWFDRMDKFLPQVINDISEDIISELREKGRLYNEFVSQTSNAG